MWALSETVRYAQSKGMIVIMDGKRNDIGSTMQAYAKAHLGTTALRDQQQAAFGSDMLTVNGYLGSDGIEPLLPICDEKDKGIFVLVKTSNLSSGELQDQKIGDKTIYETMGAMCESWGEKDRESLRLFPRRRSSRRDLSAAAGGDASEDAAYLLPGAGLRRTGRREPRT